ncbi:DUF3300 domain-containing protein [Acuticoccus kandeliae]|uniref:DUF3300 domain-containing protein n=1 Tax=Acuticoccus kandeliae TaxID=2073160 RepID=UPI00196AB631|nr:DUF3300 domain-containing protein [Acuticoccus kandeliae]
MALVLIPAIASSQVLSAPGVTTADVNFRAGPSTGDESFGVLPNGTVIDIDSCDANGWCAIAVDGVTGFVSGRYVTETEPPSLAEESADVAAAPTGEPPQYSDEELDALVAPIALYPDAVLAQVLVAATVPLDIVKAERWIEANEDLAADKRAEAANAEGWDESVAALATGFPTVIEQMAKDLDTTESLGDAVIVQSDDVLDAVQRQRARAQAVGNLSDNDAQVVQVVDNTISIAPAKPDVVYVPTYDPQTVYTQPAASAPVYVETTSSGYDAGAALATGAISFAAGYAVSSVFDNNWNDYWYGPPRIDWRYDNFYPRPGYRPGVDIDIGGDVNIGRPGRPGDRPFRPGDRPGDRPFRPGDRPGDRPLRPGDRPGFDGGLAGNRPGQRPGGDNGWRPNDKQRDQARQKIADRKGGGAGGGRQAAANRRPGGNTPAARPDRAGIESRLKAGSSGGGRQATRAGGGGQAAQRKAPGKSTAFTGHGQGGMTKSKNASARGKASQAKARKPAQRAAPSGASRAKAAKPRVSKAPTRKAAPRQSAFHKPQQKRPAAASKARGGRSMAHRGGGGGGKRGGGRRR